MIRVSQVHTKGHLFAYGVLGFSFFKGGALCRERVICVVEVQHTETIVFQDGAYQRRKAVLEVRSVQRRAEATE